MKRLFAALLCLCFFVQHASPEPFMGTVITVTAGTAIRLVTTRTMVQQVTFQMATGGSGRGYILYAPSSVTCHKGNSGTTLLFELSAASMSAPGGDKTYPVSIDPQNALDLANFCVDGSNSGDGINVSWNLR